MTLLEGAWRDYAWGSTTAIPDLLGIPPTGEPVAELWLGAHPSAPARVGPGGAPLDRVIAADPISALGDRAAADPELPFLFKVLGVAAPLSLQTHPTPEQARRGFDAEEAEGIPVDAPERNYRDRSHKPELVCALTEFDALCGFRDARSTLDLLARFETPLLDPVRQRVGREPADEGMRAALTHLLTLDQASATELVSTLCASLGSRAGWEAELDTFTDLASRYPTDPGTVVSILLNRVRLQPAQALFLGAGTLHAYLAGTAVELMANSDNVLRAGLTVKHVDVEALLEVVDTRPEEVPVQTPDVDGGVAVYASPVPEFSLTRYDLAESGPVAVRGPAIVLCVEGVADIDDQILDRGAAAWIPAAHPVEAMSGRATVYRAGVGGAGPTMRIA